MGAKKEKETACMHPVSDRDIHATLTNMLDICRNSYGYTRSTCSTDYQCPGQEKCCATYLPSGGSGGSGLLRCRYPEGNRYY